MAEAPSNLYKIITIILLLLLLIIIITIITEKRTRNTAFVPQTVCLRSTVKKKNVVLATRDGNHRRRENSVNN